MWTRHENNDDVQLYPGNRIAVGGDFSIERFIAYLTNIFLPYSKTSGNQCEQSSIYILSWH